MDAVIIVAGGTGSRMNSELPKQFLEINEKPVIIYSIEKFLNFNPGSQLIISLHKAYMNHFEKIKNQYNLTDLYLVEGGNTRYQSVKNALTVLKEDVKCVAIHDAARPLVNLSTIQKAMHEAALSGAAIPVVALHESIREVDSKGSRAVKRAHYRMVQTPQCFKKEILLQAYKQPYQLNFTDDASVVEAAGYPIALTEGNPENIKITYPQDLSIAQMLLSIC